MRKTLDRLISWTGLIMAVVLLAIGGLMTYASNFVADNVEQQLSQQDITMPKAEALETQAQKDALLQYAGQDTRINEGIPAFEEALKKANKPYTLYIYEGAQHAFNNDTSEARYNKQAADQAWSRTVAFLKQHTQA